jgi:hypothetical protein
MPRYLSVLLLGFVLCASAFPQSRGIIQCDPGMDKIPAWTAPGRAYAADQLDCGQGVNVINLESGYMRIQIGEKFVYVDAKFVRMLQTLVPPPTASVTPGMQVPAPPPANARKSMLPSGRSGERWPRHEGGLSFELSNIYYDEPEFMRNKGFMWGVSGDYIFRPNNFEFRVDGRFSSGEVDYWSDRTGIAKGLGDYNFETRFSLGYDLKIASSRAAFTPFTGLGYRFLFDGSEGTVTSSGATGYDRKSNYLYIPAGVETKFGIKGGWSIVFSGEYDYLWHGWQYSELGYYQLVPGLIEVPDYVAKDDQEEGWGARGSIRFIKNIGRIDFKIEPYFRYWAIEDSDGLLVYVIGYPNLPFGGYEPANSTTEWGMKLGIGF